MFVVRNMFGLRVASFATPALALAAAAAGSGQRGYVAEVWYETTVWTFPGGHAPSAELVVTFRGPSTHYPDGFDDKRSQPTGPPTRSAFPFPVRSDCC